MISSCFWHSLIAVVLLTKLAWGTAADKTDYGKLILDSFNVVDSNAEEFQKIWDLNGYYKVCFAGSPSCMEGTYEQIMQPFVDALKTYRMTGSFMIGVDQTGTGFLTVNAFMETKLGCKAMYSGVSYNEFDPDSGKIVKHISYSDDSQELMKCVGEYFASLEEKEL